MRRLAEKNEEDVIVETSYFNNNRLSKRGKNGCTWYKNLKEKEKRERKRDVDREDWKYVTDTIRDVSDKNRLNKSIDYFFQKYIQIKVVVWIKFMI